MEINLFTEHLNKLPRVLVIILGDNQKPSGHGPGKPALDDPVCVGELDTIPPEVPFQPQLLSDSVKW